MVYNLYIVTQYIEYTFGPPFTTHICTYYNVLQRPLSPILSNSCIYILTLSLSFFITHSFSTSVTLSILLCHLLVLWLLSLQLCQPFPSLLVALSFTLSQTLFCMPLSLFLYPSIALLLFPFLCCSITYTFSVFSVSHTRTQHNPSPVCFLSLVKQWPKSLFVYIRYFYSFMSVYKH